MTKRDRKTSRNSSERPEASNARARRTLREKAESLLQTNPGLTPVVSTSDVQSLIQELGVHQIELQAQNDELRLAQLHLAETCDRYSDLYDFAPVGYFTLDPAAAIVETNLTAAGMFGIERARLVSKKIHHFIDRDSQDDWFLYFRRVLASEENHSCELTFRRENGETFVAHVQGVVARNAEPGAPVRCRMSLTDISDRKRAEDTVRRARDELERRVEERTADLSRTVERLQEEVARRELAEHTLRERSFMLEGFYQHAITPLVFLDPEFNFIRVNEAYARACQKDVGEFPGHNHFEFYPHEENETIFREVVRSKKPYRAVAKPFSFPDHPEWGVSYWDWTLTPEIDAKGKVVFLVFALEDVTRRVEAEESVRAANEEMRLRAEQLARLASELTLAERRERRRLAKMLHDHLQQLLVGAKYALASLARRVPENQASDVKHVEDLISESLRASRTLTVELSPPIIHEAGLDVAMEWLARWMKEKHGLTVDVESDERATTDREDVKILVFESVRELLFNAVKHAGVSRAGVELGIDEQERLRVVVSDEGAGFDAQSVWSRHAHAGATEEVAAGFGLLSVRERLGVLGGALEIESAPGKGSRFTLIVPPQSVRADSESSLADLAQPPSRPETVALSSSAGDRADPKIRILIADDHHVMRRGMALLLAEEPEIEIVAEVSDGAEAVEMARSVRPDVILMDFSMPRMDGVEATRRIHAELPGIAIVGLSMYEEADRAAAMLEAGAAAYVSKSGEHEVLLGVIRGCIKGRAMQDGPGDNLDPQDGS